MVVPSATWAEESEQDRLRAVLTETKGKLPVVEVGCIVIAMWRPGAAGNSSSCPSGRRPGFRS